MFRIHSEPKLILLKADKHFHHFPRTLQHVSKRFKGHTTAPRKPTANALALELYKQSGYGKRTNKSQLKGDRSRLNIVSESLCGKLTDLHYLIPILLTNYLEHVVERLAASLRKHKNCDIIDVNPGVGLWSSKLHNAIKPRTHILMEPDVELYMPFLDPLLKKQKSTYKLVAESGIIWDSYKKLEAEGYLAHQKLLSKGDLQLEQSNDSLLFIANLGYYPNKAYQGFPSITTLMIHQLLSAVRTHSIFQSYGLVRMLVWMRDKEKRVVFPRVISQRKKFAVEAEITCNSIFEIAGSDELPSTWRREHALDLEGAQRVLGNMAKYKLKTPDSRIGKLEREASQKANKLIDASAATIRPFLKDLEEMEARFARREFCSYYDDEGNPVYLNSESMPAKALRNGTRTPEWTQLLKLRYRLNQANSITDKLDYFLMEHDSLAAEYSKLQDSDSEEAQHKKAELDGRRSKWRVKVESLPGNLESLLWQRIDDRRAFRQDPPILLWDRREVEPLKVVDKDFFPHQEMCLLDFQPKSIWSVFKGKDISTYDYFDFMIAALYTNPTHSIVRGLKALAPGADEWIIPRCPSLTDTAKGGAIDLEQLSIRTLNQEMLRELMEAWMEWPFQPTKAEMMVRAGTRSNMPGDEDDFDHMTAGL